MNKHHILNTLKTTDAFTQLSALGALQFALSAEAIRQAMKIVPDHPTPETMEAFFNEERNLKFDVRYTELRDLGDGLGSEVGERVPLMDETADVATTPGNYREERRTLSALLDFRNDVMDALEDAASALPDPGEERTLENTLQFMIDSQRPDPAQFAAQYTRNMRLGMKNYGQTRAQYVEQEMKRALEQREVMIAKGEYAVRFLEGLDAREGPIDEAFLERLAARCVAKLIARRMKIGQSLAWRTDPDQRQDAEADILFIEKAVEALGGEVPAEVPLSEEAVEQSEAPAFDASMLQAFQRFLAHEASKAKPAIAPKQREPGEVVVTTM